MEFHNYSCRHIEIHLWNHIYIYIKFDQNQQKEHHPFGIWNKKLLVNSNEEVNGVCCFYYRNGLKFESLLISRNLGLE